MSHEQTERIPIRRKEYFWKVVALAALLLCAWLAVERGGREARADNGGATTAGLIALMGVNAADERLYIIDTNTRTIMVYETGIAAQTKLISARSYENDLGFATSQPGRFLKFKAAGYEEDVAKHFVEVQRDKKQK